MPSEPVHRHAPRLLVAGFVLAGWLVPVVASAQPVTVPRFDFSFSNPGARSQGFGGAFAALADDATAAFANPAGLVQLTEPEVSAELRYWHRTPSFLAGGRFEGETTGIGLDTTNGPVFGQDSSRTFGPSFAAVVIPKGRWSFALYGHRLADLEQVADSQGFFLSRPFVDFGQESSGVDRFPGSRETIELDAVSAGLATGVKLSERLSLGLSVVYTDVRLDARSAFYLTDDPSEDSLFGTIHYLPERRISESKLRADDSDVTWSAGLLWNVSARFALGLFYRRGASVSGRLDTEYGPSVPFNEIVTPPDVVVELRLFNPAVFAIPDVAGAGLAYRSADGRFTVATEVNHVGYEGLIRVVETEDSDLASREYRDAWEYHLGAELALLRSAPILAFRAGVWVEQNGDDLAGRNVTHWSGGVGIAGGVVQVDLAADISESGDTLSLSTIYTF
ncbi:MAG: outer membrane protein transport protein [Acidobacteria bacterium]|nr:outer membrane protein transport protein [Acidobacteriota bacterium]